MRLGDYPARWLVIGLIAALFVGAKLRLIWPGDLEYKSDESYMVEQVRNAGRSEPWPALGMESGASLAAVRNPGMSVWVYILPARLLHAEDPLGMARITEWSSIAALLIWTGFALLCVNPGDREAWLWAVALIAVNPLQVELDRKIWSPCMLPLLDCALLIGWWYRREVWGAFLWGLAGAWAGQIHMSGLVFAAALFLWTALFERRLTAPEAATYPGLRPETTKWPAWIIGSALGAVTLYPWIRHVLSSHLSGAAPVHPNGFPFRFWQLWVLDSLGLHMQVSLTTAFSGFLRFPMIAGRATYLVLLLHAALAGLALVIFVRAGLAMLRDKRSWIARFVGCSSQSAFLVSASMWGFGLLMTGCYLWIHSHYLMVALPFAFVWLARMALLSGDQPAEENARARSLSLSRRLLMAVCGLELLLSVAFLCFIHLNGGAPGSDYGIAYHAQTH
jgi:hypothetical protein